MRAVASRSELGDRSKDAREFSLRAQHAAERSRQRLHEQRIRTQQQLHVL
jgi:hypothetical protein